VLRFHLPRFCLEEKNILTIVATFITGESDDPHLLERCRALVERLLNYNDLEAAVPQKRGNTPTLKSHSPVARSRGVSRAEL
jgi:hypothetical protein